MSTTSTPPQRPSTNDPDEWPAYWKALDQPWRTQPEIDGDRQNFLKKCLAIVSDLQWIRISAPEKGTVISKRKSNSLRTWLRKRRKARDRTGVSDNKYTVRHA